MFEMQNAVVRFIASLTDLEDPSQFASHVLPAISGLVGCDIITYNEVAPGQVRYADFPEFSLDPETKTVFAEHVHEHARHRLLGRGTRRFGCLCQGRQFDRHADG